MVKGTGGVKTGMTGHTKRIEYFKTSVKSYAWYATTSPISDRKEHRDINMDDACTSCLSI